MNRVRFAIVFAVLVFTRACWGQAGSALQINTANAGAQTADINAAVGVICASSNIMRSKNGPASGCRVCPEGTDFHGDGRSQWDLYAETPGHFTSPQDDNLILSGSGCDSHANNFGGSFVFSLTSNTPRLLKYNPALITDGCHKFALADRRDSLVCQGGWTGMGEGDSVAFMATFDATGKNSTTNLIRAMDTTGMCGDDPDEVVQEADIKEVAFSTTNSGKVAGMTVTAMRGSVKCSVVKSEQKTGKLAPAVKTYTIEFLFDGKHFKAAPSSRAALNRFASD